MSQDQTGPSAKPAGASEPARPPRSRLTLYLTGGVITLLILLAAGVWVWKALAVRSLEARLASARNESSSARRQALTMQARDLLRLTARPLAWAIRAELLRSNLGQVDDYFREFVRERGVSSLMLVGPDGRIVLATDRKRETQPADGLVSKALLEATDVAVEEAGTTLRLGVPVMGFDKRLGLLVVDYDSQAR